ncbi:MATE family efflux transporter [Clostridium sp. 'deep sea']|uniref:MATE family efflux transporter n=1 Tax=Clostridium sp. 'deep sea' TaxID=2779445 RepID=UPI00189668C3|nr:MATE family efflux transporter [Clostridium sp. 'deep sea']QOR36583.1 MATE family efflux transporter [Clostridium sp. 'deep sea']
MKSRDLTQGSIVKNIMYMSIPVMFSMVTQTLYDLVDMIWIGKISAGAMAGVTVFSSIYFLVFVLNNVIGNGSVAVLSQSFGSGNHEEARKGIANTFAFKLMAGIIASIILYIVLEPLLGVFAKDAQTLRDALQYGRIRVLFLPVMFSSFTVTTALRCSGDSKSPMIITMITAGLNIVLDPIFIFETIPGIGLPGFGLGVFGAALATVISTTLSFIIAYWIMFGPKSSYSLKLTDLFTFDWNIIGRIVKIGLPQAVSGLIRNLANVIILGFVTAFGTYAIAAWGIIGRLFGLLFMPVNGLVQGGSTVVGQNIGGGRLDRAEKAGFVAGKFGFISMLAICALAYLFTPQIIGIFNDEKEVIKLGVSGLRYGIMCMPIIAAYMGRATVFAGSGYTLPFLVAGIVSQWGVQIPLIFLFSKVLKLPFQFIPLSYLGFALCEGIVIWGFYKKGTWRKKAEEAAYQNAPVPAD